ncbi:MAG: autotransporter domain-containing protein [Endomicrobiaceae bacterium]|nr:autotransporter domain-containing protein [Endomicrobiaceae bacterium]
MDYFSKSSVRFFVVLFMSVAVSASAVFATISGDNTSENYTYSSDSSADTIYTNTMTGSGYWNSVSGSSVTLNPTTAITLTVDGTASGGLVTWYGNQALDLYVPANLNLNSINFTNNALIKTSTITISSDSYFSTSADNLDTYTYGAVVNNNGYLSLYGGTNYNDIVGSGWLGIYDSVINNADIIQDYMSVTIGASLNNVAGSSITVNNLQINSSALLETDIDDISVVNSINHAGTLRINADGTNYNDISGVGVLEITNNSTVTNSAYAQLGQLKINSGSVFITDIDNINTTYLPTGIITNNGLLTINAGGNNINNMEGTGELEIDSPWVTNSANITQSTITINSGSTFETNASLLTVSNSIVNNSQLTFTGGTNDNEITGTGDLFNTGNITNNGNIGQGSFHVTSGTFTNNGEITAINMFVSSGATLLTRNMLDTYTAGGAIYNDGLLQVDVDNSSGTVDNANLLTGTGELEILGNTIFNQQAGVTITQSTITISDNASMTANADDLIVSDKIYNDGNLTLNGYLEYNNNDISGTGSLFINGLIGNTRTIDQANLTIYDSMGLGNDEGSTITITDTLLVGTTTLAALLQNDGVLNVVNGVNNGSITYGTTSEGILNISGHFTNNGNMSQEELYISSSAYVITNASNSNIHKFISNDGDFIFTGGISDDKIIGTGTLTYNGAESNLTNTADINQFAVNITSGTFNNIAGSSITATNINIDEAGELDADIDDIDTYTAGGRILNNGLIEFGINDSGENFNAITGSGRIEIFNGYTLFNSSSIVQGSIANAETFVNNGVGTVNADVFENYAFGQNDGVMNIANFTNDGPFVNTSTGIINAGTLINTDIFANNGNANIDYLINTDSSVFFNDNYLNIEGGLNLGTISRQNGVGFGTMTVTNGVFDNSGGTIIQYTAIIENGGHLITDADHLILDTGISNDSILEFTGGTIVNPVTGSGTLLITGVVGSSSTIDQAHLGVYGDFRNSSNTYVNSAFIDAGANVVNDSGSNLFIDSLTNNGNIDNSAVRGSGFEVGNVLNNGAITGTGDIQIYGTFINESSGTLSQANINIVSETAGLISNASSLTGNINNAGTLVLTGGTNNNVISWFDSTPGDLVINGTVTNTANIAQRNLTVTTGGNFINNNNTDVSFYGGTNVGQISGNGTLNINGDFYNSGSGMQQSNVNIDGGLFQNISQLTATNLNISSDVEFRTDMDYVLANIENYGMIITNGGTNTNAITGNGALLVFGGAMINDGSITQDDLGINSDSTLRTSAQSLTIANGIENNGTLFIDHAISADTNANDIRGDGIIRIVNGTDLTNTGEIRQEGMAITNGSTLHTDASLLYIANRILNNGTLDFNVTGNNANNVTGSGTLSITNGAEVVNTGTIGQNLILIEDIGSSFTSDASLLNGTTEIANGWDLHFTGGFNTSTITKPDDGALFIDGDVENANGVNIEQNVVLITSNNRFTTNAGDLDINNIIHNNGILQLKDATDSTLDEDVDGSGVLVKTGAGIVELTGANTYTGQTIITEGALQISDESNIGDNAIGFDGGKLIASANNFTINNQLTGTEGNNVNIDVIDGHLYLDGVIDQQSTTPVNLVKDGNGVLELEMDENYYQGDTYVNNGTLIGTTENINGRLFGTGVANLDTYEFTDGVHYSDSIVVSALYPKAPSAYGYDVVLNEVDSTDYIGTFNKTGSASMEVINYFRAYQANITGGALYVNNIESDNGFVVDSTMTFTNSLLGGNSIITAETVVMGADSTLAPGNSIGVTNIVGDLVFASSSTYEVEFEQTSMPNGGVNNDTTNVSGTTTIDSNNTLLDLINIDGKFFVHETFDIITSSDTLTGEFANSSITGFDIDTPDLRLGSRIDFSTATVGNVLQVNVSRKASEYENSTELTDMSHNESEVARSIDAISTGNGGDITYALDALEQYYYYTSTYDLDALKAGFNDIAGVIYANSALLPYFNAKTEHVYDRIQSRNAEINPCHKFHDKIWGEYYYNNYGVDGNENSPNYNTYVNGFLVGFDMISEKSWTMGIMSGYGESTLNQENDSTNMKDVNLGLYGGYETNKWQFKSMLFAGWERYNTERDIAFMDRTAKSNSQGYSTSFDLEGAYKILLTKNADAKHKVTLKPFAGVFASYMKQNGFEETGADALNLKVEDSNILMAQARLGVGVTGKVSKFGWYANVGARQLLTRDYAETYVSLLDYSDETNMKIKSAPLSPFSISGGIGADYILSEDWTIFANGQTNLARRSKEIYANIGLTYKFGCPKKDAPVVVTVVDEDFASKLENEKKVSEGLRKELKQLQKDYEKMKSKIVTTEQAKKIKERKITQVELESKLQFKFNSTELTEKGKASLQQVLKELQRYPDAELLIEGHCDNFGAPAYNQKLSEGRASAVAISLEKDYGIKNKISVIGKGSNENLVPNDSPANREINRRVEIIIVQEEEVEVLVQ